MKVEHKHYTYIHIILNINVQSQTFGYTQLKINLEALVHNWKQLCNYAMSTTVGATVKANAYGLGAIAITEALYQSGCRHFFVAYASEGQLIRTVAPESNIYLLQGILPECLPICQKSRLIPVLNSYEQVSLWHAFVQSQSTLEKPLMSVLGLDTGMNRNGLTFKEIVYLCTQPNLIEQLNISYYFSHLASSDCRLDQFNQEQLVDLERSRQLLPDRPLCLSNSGGIFLGEAYHLDLVRPGLSLYGIADCDCIELVGLKPVISVYSKITQVFEADIGDSVGYNQSHILTRNSRLVCMSSGYADGLSRALSKKGIFYIQGYPLSILGKVSMDCIILDATDVPAELCYNGQIVEILGQYGSIEALSTQAGTIPHEILVMLGNNPRVKHIYI